MSIELMTLVWKVPFPTSTQMLIALKLADHAEDDGSSIYPGRASLADKARCSVSTVKNTLRLFRAAGILIVVKEGGAKGPHDTTEYKMNVSLLRAIVSCDVTIDGSSESIDLTWSESSGKMGSEFDPVRIYPGSGLPLPGQPAALTGSAGSPQPINNHHYPSAGARARDATAPHAPAAQAEPPRLVLQSDGEWYHWLSIVDKSSARGSRQKIDFEKSGGMVVFAAKPSFTAALPTLPPAKSSARYAELLADREQRALANGLTEKSRRMSGDAA